MLNNFLVVKWDWVEEALNDKELEDLYDLISKATYNRPDYRYYVINTDEPYVDKIKSIVEKGDSKISRDDLLANLRELSTLEDAEIAHAEAEELLLSYVNDPEIDKIFEGMPR